MNKTLQIISICLICLLIAGFLVTPVSAQAGILFVGPGGDDTDDCLTEATACLTINAAIGKAAAGDTINVLPGTYSILDSSDRVLLNKANITINGAGAGSTIFETQLAAGYVFYVTANGVTLNNFEIHKLDKAGPQNLVYVQADNFTLSNSLIHGDYAFGDPEVSRGLEVAYGSENMTITGNTFYHLRQPGYLNGSEASPTTELIANNLVYTTRGWLIAGANMAFDGNTWSNGSEVNVFDVAIISATPATYYPNLIAVSEANNDAVIEDQRVSPAVLTVVRVDSDALTVGDGGPSAPYPAIQTGVNRVMPGGKVLVAKGSYLEEVNVNKAGVHLIGSGYQTTIIMGRKDAGGANTLIIGANNVTVSSFTVTRDGNTVADWGTNVKTQGVIFSQNTAGSTLRDCLITGNRNGVYLNNSQNQTVRNNIITNNRTGIQLVNNVTGLVMTENKITNNWTMGLLFNFNNVGLYTTNVQITNNDISGNWYGEVQNRWAVENGVMNVSGNWFGTTAVTTSAVNSVEPPYADQIPVIFGGTATPPATPMETIGGLQSAKVDYSPWLGSGTDTDALEIGFQGGTTTLFVDDTAQAPGTGSAIQEAIDLAPAGGTVNVFPGSYGETAANRTILDLGGVYQFGLFFDADKPGVTVQGVDASGAPVTGYADVAASVTTNATNNFGPSGVFVEGDNITLSGVRILPNVGGDNKTIEVIGDNFSLKASVIDVPGGGSVYLNDWRFDTDTDVSYLQGYSILNNLFAQSASLDITSGAGYTGPVAGRVIQGNRFEYTPDAYWPAISFSGNSVVPWFTDPINGATITGNTFAGTTQHIRARGGYDTTTFDWLAYRANNTFEKSVLAFVGNTTEVRSFEYPTSYGTMTNVRRLTTSIQFGVDDAIDGDTVDVSAGTFTEQVIVSEDILLQGADGASTIQAFDAMPSCFTTPSSANNRPVVCVKDTNNATITGFTVDGKGLGNTNNRFYGIAFRNAGGTVQNNTVRDIRDTPFSGTQHGNGIYAYNDDAIARTLHILDNAVTGFQKTGIATNASDTNPLTVDIQRNTVTGQGATDITAQNGIQVNAPAGTGVVADNVISGIAYDNTNATTKWVATSILNYYTNLDTTGNIITGAHMGIYYWEGRGLIENNDLTIEKVGVYAYGINAADPPQAVPSPFDSPVSTQLASNGTGINAAVLVSPVEVAHNTLTFSGTDKTATYGIEADAGYENNDLAVDVHHNTVNGFEYGLAFSQCAADCGLGVFESISAVSNNLTDNTFGIHFDGPIPARVIPVIRHNRIFGDVATDAGLVNDLTVEINAENNWWGCNAGPADAACVGITGLVDTNPWLVLTFTADQTNLIPGGAIYLTADLSQNSAGLDTTALGSVMDGLLIDFDTTYGTLDPLSLGLVNASTATTLTVPAPATVPSAKVWAEFDNQIVEIVFGGRYYIFLPLIFR